MMSPEGSRPCIVCLYLFSLLFYSTIFAARASAHTASPAAPQDPPTTTSQLNDYRQFLATLDKEKLKSFHAGLDYYRTHFTTAPQPVRDEACAEYHRFWRQAIGCYEAGQRRGPRAGTTNHGTTLTLTAGEQAVGIRVYFDCEGFVFMGEETSYFTRQFRGAVSPTVQAYFALNKIELEKPPFAEGYPTVSFLEIGRRLATWEDYLINFPKTPFKREALDQYRFYLNTFLFGCDADRKSPVFDQMPEALNAYSVYLKEHPNTPSGRLVRYYHRLLEQNGFRPSPEIIKDIKKKQEELSTGSPR